MWVNWCVFQLGITKNVVPPRKTHRFTHLKWRKTEPCKSPPHADTTALKPGHPRATQPHSDRVFSGFNRAFGNSDKISTTFDTNSPHLDRVPFNSDRVPTIFDAVSPHFNNVSTYSDGVSAISDTVFIISSSVSTCFGSVSAISNAVSVHFNRVSSIFNIIAGSPMTHSLQRAGPRYRSPVHRLNRLLHTWHGTEMNSQGTLNLLFNGQCSKCR